MPPAPNLQPDAIHRPIVLIGLMGVGKSTVGRRLANRLRLSFVDSDHEIEEAAGLTIAEMFEKYGEEEFRDGERRVIARLIDGTPKVIATGGGAFMNEQTRALILDRATAIWLDADVKVLAERVGRRAGSRPLLKDGDPREKLAALAEVRNPIYALAPIHIRSRPLPHDATVEAIVQGAQPMIRVDVGLGERSYPILIDAGVLDRAGEMLAPFARGGRLIVVTDENVAATQLPRLVASLAGITVAPIVLPAGEATKSWAMLERLSDQLLDLGVERSDRIIALGGGVIGDLVGFAASILKRGCGFVQIPTTLLAQVDSSVGGKTAINTRAGKNLVGAFHQPDLVLIDPSTLDTLAQREVRAGYAEVVKYGLIDDFAFFSWCEANAPALFVGDADARTHAIAQSVSAKARVVAADERETTGTRALLNLGHTFGHALEAETGFSDRLLHGEAVACGMALAFRFSMALGLCPGQDAERVTRHLVDAGLPATLASAHVDTTGATLVAHMAHDKKMDGGRLPFLLARGIGQTFLAKDVDLAEVARFLDRERMQPA